MEKTIEEMLKYLEGQLVDSVEFVDDALVIQFASGDQVGVACVEGQLSVSFDIE